MNRLETLRLLIEKGFYYHNICDIISLCNDISDDQYILLAHTLKGIYYDILPFFDETPVSGETANRLNSALVPEILSIIKKIQDGCSKSDQYDLLFDIVKLSRNH